MPAASKFATGAVFSGGGVPAPSLQAEASTSVPITTANRPIDRIESSHPRSDIVSGEATGWMRCDITPAHVRRMRQSRASRRRTCRRSPSPLRNAVVLHGLSPLIQRRLSSCASRPTTVAAVRPVGSTGAGLTAAPCRSSADRSPDSRSVRHHGWRSPPARTAWYAPARTA